MAAYIEMPQKRKMNCWEERGLEGLSCDQARRGKDSSLSAAHAVGTVQVLQLFRVLEHFYNKRLEARRNEVDLGSHHQHPEGKGPECCPQSQSWQEPWRPAEALGRLPTAVTGVPGRRAPASAQMEAWLLRIPQQGGIWAFSRQRSQIMETPCQPSGSISPLRHCAAPRAP